MRKFFTTKEIWCDHHIDANIDDNTKLIPDTNLNVSTSSSTSSINDNNSNLLMDRQDCTTNSDTIKNSRLASESSTSSNYIQFSQAPVITNTVKTIDVNNGVEITHTTVKSTSNFNNKLFIQNI